VGAEAGDSSTEDVILVRGASSEVDRAVGDILGIVENAKNDEIVNSYVSRDVIYQVYGARLTVFLVNRI
jgi:hypothetical protein